MVDDLDQLAIKVPRINTRANHCVLVFKHIFKTEKREDAVVLRSARDRSEYPLSTDKCTGAVRRTISRGAYLHDVWRRVDVIGRQILWNRRVIQVNGVGFVGRRVEGGRIIVAARTDKRHAEYHESDQKVCMSHEAPEIRNGKKLGKGMFASKAPGTNPLPPLTVS